LGSPSFDRNQRARQDGGPGAVQAYRQTTRAARMGVIDRYRSAVDAIACRPLGIRHLRTRPTVHRRRLRKRASDDTGRALSGRRARGWGSRWVPFWG
jgi:hypothetical protein